MAQDGITGLDLLPALGAAVGAAADYRLRRDCRLSLMEFTRFCWPIIDPGTPMLEGNVLDAIALHLEAVHLGTIRRLLITVPPGCSKSTLTSVCFPAWCWGPQHAPHLRFISASYSEHLSVRDNNRCRRILNNDGFRRLWPHVELMAPTTARKFENTRAGWKLATSVGGVAIGERCDVWLIDDPNSAVGMESETVRETTNRWFREVVPTRLNNPTTGAIVLIQQRMHLEDVAGIALGQGDWVHLNLPMEYEPRTYVQGWNVDDGCIETMVDAEAEALPASDVFWKDWRCSEGDLLWPERFSRPTVDRLKRQLGPTAASAMLQQRPVPRGGAIIKAEWWQAWRDPKFPPFEFVVASLDTAYTEKRRNDPSGMAIWGLCKDVADNPRIILLHAWQDFLAFHDLVQRVIRSCTRSLDYGPAGADRFPVDMLLIEGKASGLSVAQELERLCGQSGLFGIDIINPVGDKTNRLHAIEHILAGGTVWAPDRAYADMVIDQVASFPYAGHDEFVDCTTMALQWLRDRGYAPTREERHDAEAALLAYRPKMQPLYPA